MSDCDDICDGDPDCMDVCKSKKSKGTKITTQKGKKQGYYRNGPNAATIGWVILIGLAVVGTGVNLGYSYFANVIPTKNARDYLHIAMEYTDFESIKGKLEQVKELMDEYSGNANWLPWATVDTSFDEVKALIDSNIAQCEFIIATYDPITEANAIQTALYTFTSNTLPATAERLGWIIDYMLWRPMVVLIEVLVAAPLVIVIVTKFFKEW